MEKKNLVQPSERALERHQKEREVLFENEALATKVLQAVSGASLIAALTQADTLIRLAGRIPFLCFLSAMALALLAAVFAIHWKHQYKMWDVKAAIETNVQSHAAKARRSSIYLQAMRGAMWASLVLICAGFLALIASLWVVGLTVPEVVHAV